MASTKAAICCVDGRDARIPGYENGSFVRPTMLQNVPWGSEFARTEIFGPVLGLMHRQHHR